MAKQFSSPLPDNEDVESISRWEFDVSSRIYAPRRARVVTTDATTTDLILLPIADDRVYGFKAFVVARQIGGGSGDIDDSMGFLVFGGFYGDTGSATAIPRYGTTTSWDTSNIIGLNPTSLTWTADFNTLGSLVSLEVTGEADKEIEWSCAVEQISLS